MDTVYHTSCQRCGNELEGKRRCPLCGTFCCARCGTTKVALFLIRRLKRDGRMCCACIAETRGEST